MYLSLNQFNRIMKNWSATDPNIQQYGWGPFWGQNGVPKVEQKYPGMYIVPEQTTLDNNSLKRRFQVIFYDLVWEQSNTDTMRNNLNDVHSDTEEMCQRLRRWLENDDNQDYFEVNGASEPKPFQDKWLDAVAGHAMSIEIIFTTGGICGDPDNDITY